METPPPCLPPPPALRHITESRGPPNQTLDLLGALLLSTALTCIVLACERCLYWGFTHIGTVGLMALGLLLLVSFARVENRVQDPLLDLRYLKNTTVFASLVCPAAMQCASLAVAVSSCSISSRSSTSPRPSRLAHAARRAGLADVLSGGRAADRPGMARLLLVGGLLVGAGAMIWLNRGTDLGHGLLLVPPLHLRGGEGVRVRPGEHPHAVRASRAGPRCRRRHHRRGAGDRRCRRPGGPHGVADRDGVELPRSVAVAVRHRLHRPSQEAIDSLLFEDDRSPLLASMPPELPTRTVSAADEAFVDGLQAVMISGAAFLTVAALLTGLAIRRPLTQLRARTADRTSTSGVTMGLPASGCSGR